MLSNIRVQRYKSLFEIEVDLEPLTVLIGPNGSGKSNICEAIAVLSNFIQQIMQESSNNVHNSFLSSLRSVDFSSYTLESKFWHGVATNFVFQVEAYANSVDSHNTEAHELTNLAVELHNENGLASFKSLEIGEIVNQNPQFIRSDLMAKKFNISPLSQALKLVKIYDFNPTSLSTSVGSTVDSMSKTGGGIAYELGDLLLDNRESFNDLEAKLIQLVPNIKRISLSRKKDVFHLQLVDKYSEHHIPASDISDGTLRLLAFLTALYQKETPSIICFEEPENGVHPWLLSKMMELLQLISTEGLAGKPVQVLITTHSPVLLNYVEPQQVRAIELDSEGKTQVHSLPFDSVRFQKAMEAFDGELGELWFTDIFGGNPE